MTKISCAAGWVYAEATPTDCVAVGGHFLHAGAMTRQLQTALIEEHLALRRQNRFPQFYQVHSCFHLFICSSHPCCALINVLLWSIVQVSC